MQKPKNYMSYVLTVNTISGHFAYMKENWNVNGWLFSSQSGIGVKWILSQSSLKLYVQELTTLELCLFLHWPPSAHQDSNLQRRPHLHDLEGPVKSSLSWCPRLSKCCQNCRCREVYCQLPKIPWSRIENAEIPIINPSNVTFSHWSASGMESLTE